MKHPTTAGISLSVLLTLAFLHHPALAAKYETRVYTTARAAQAPALDGRLEDECWNLVEWGTDFVQFEPEEGALPSQPTAFKILYDDDALYFGVRAYDSSPEEIVDLLARRDRFPGDWVEINIDSYFDHRTAFSFTSSVSGTRGDEFISDDGNNWDGNWDPVWELATHIDDQGWSLEARIPFSQLRFAERDEHVWGIQVTRRIYREEERSLWQPKSKDETGWVSRFGELRGITGIEPPRRVELLPYGLTKGETFAAEPGNPFVDGQDGDIAFGMDGKVGVTSDLTLDFTINPDFGQVEADPSEVNLTAFETFFSERRPFFIEGNNILDFQIAPAVTGGSFTRDNLFYSRRVGRRPLYSPDLHEDEFAEAVDNTSILGAAKLSGKTGGGLSVGILESVTARERAQVRGAGVDRVETVEPLTNFFVGRVQQDWAQGDTRLGGMVTAVNRRIDDAHLEFLHGSAYSAGIDFLRRWNDRAWRFDFNGAVSHVRGDASAIERTQLSSARYFQRPDNDYVDFDPDRSSLSGHAGSFRLAKVGGDVRFETGGAWRSPGFEINDAGFLRQADEINQFTWAGYRVEEPFSIFRGWWLNTNQWLSWDFGGTNLTRQFNANTNAHFKNNWRLGFGVTRGLESVSNTRLRGGPASKWPGWTNFNLWVNGDDRKTLSYGFGGNIENGDDGSSLYRGGWLYANFRPSNAVRLFVEPSVSRHDRDMQYFQTSRFGDESRYLFGSIDQRTFGFTLRLDYSITPNLTVQYYGAPFVSSGRYSTFKRVTDPQAAAYRDRFHVFADDEIAFVDGEYRVDEDQDGTVDYTWSEPDFNFKDFNSNLVLRWEFQPGSTVFVVWSQARTGLDPVGRFDVGRDLDDLFGIAPHNVFLVKINKWFSL